MSLNNFRAQLNLIDTQILELLTQRMAISRQIGDYKRQNNLPVIDRVRERQHIQQLQSQSSLPKSLIRSLMTIIYTYSRQVQQ